METKPGSQERNVLFQKLKPCCVKISQLAIRESEMPEAVPEMNQLIKQVLSILNDQIQHNPAVMDEKLAEYVFFPLYHIFRQVDSYPMPLVENCVKCLAVLIVHGWKSRITPKLVQQILSLLTFIIDGVPGTERKREVPEETVLEALRAQTALLTTASLSATAASGLADPETIPALGHGITVMLEAVVDGATPSIQREATSAVQAVYTALREHEALASFLPGTISSLAKLLSSPNRSKKLVLARCLETVRTVLTRVLADMRTRSILAKDKMAEEDETAAEDKNKILSSAWLKATVAQVKLALSSIVKLRTHDAAEVRESLKRLCVSLLDECHTTLSNCTAVLVETAMVLDDTSNDTSIAVTTLGDLVSIYPGLAETIKTIVYGWLSSLPRIMQTSDENVKQTATRNLSMGIELLRSLGIESSTLNDSLSSTLRDCIVSVALTSNSQPAQGNANVQMLDDTISIRSAPGESPYSPILLAHQSQKTLRKEMISLLGTIGAASQQSTIAASMMEYARGSTASSQVAAFWLCFELVKAAKASTADVDALLDLSAFSGSPEESTIVFDELYDFSVQVLDSHADQDSVDWRLEAMALEVTAYAAHKSGEAFRPELIDVLFPIATFLGSDNESLRQHAVTTLNCIAVSCQYSSVSELIIANVDYMVNSVSLRLNTLDISPASTQVLLMMIRLAGPRLIPFLDDVIDSIFAALDNYHGYPLFVESLFSVLKEVVDQASGQNMRLLADHERSTRSHKKKRVHTEGFDELLAVLDKRKARKDAEKVEDEEIETIKGHPKVPWKTDSKGEEDGEEQDEASTAPPEEVKPQNSPTYQLLLRVATLTQHYLTSPTPRLRRLLLELLTTSSVVLAGDEEAFLPLVNATWPVIIERLRDPEAFITIEACTTLAGLCEAAGDFMSSRFKTEWFDGLGNWCRKVKLQATRKPGHSKPQYESTSLGGKQDIVIPIRSGDNLEVQAKSVDSKQVSSGSLGQHASPVKIWEAVIRLLTAIVTYVRVDDVMFDEILDLLSDAMERDDKVKEALEVVNADAVWLVRYERGYIEPISAPEVDGFEMMKMATM